MLLMFLDYVIMSMNTDSRETPRADEGIAESAYDEVGVGARVFVARAKDEARSVQCRVWWRHGSGMKLMVRTNTLTRTSYESRERSSEQSS
jgi:hypothetical protein